MMNRFLIRTNVNKDEGLLLTNQIKEYLESKGKEVILELLNQSKIKDDNSVERFTEETAPDLVLVLGGDGTMLRAARDFMHLDVSLLGVNLGSLGYLTEVESDKAIAALEKVLAGDYEIEERMMLEGEMFVDGKKVGSARALNDIAIIKQNAFDSIDFNIFVNGEFLKDYNGDGVIFSTPTGSTGYNLSVGGPIVEPSASLIVMSLVSPHTLMSRSIILSDTDEVRVELKESKSTRTQEAMAMADAHSRFNMNSGDSFVLRKSEQKIKIVKLNNLSFLEVLHRKLS